MRRSNQGWELAGIDKAFIDKFSRRTEQIEAAARALGIQYADAQSELGAKTRERKQKDLSMSQQQAVWRGRMMIAERRALALLKAKLGNNAESGDNAGAGRRDDAANFIDDTLRRLAFFSDLSRQRPTSGFRERARVL